MKYIITISFLLFSFCSFAQTVGETIDSATASKMIWVRGPRIDTFYYNKLSPSMKEFIDTLICKHIYVAVEQSRVERNCHITEHPMLRDLILNRDWREPKIGSHQQDHDDKDMAEGIAIVCVKCHHETKQNIHYSHK